MSLEDQMTNEEIKKEFDNNFELVNFAIQLAKQDRGEEEEFLPLKEILKETLTRAKERNSQEIESSDV